MHFTVVHRDFRIYTLKHIQVLRQSSLLQLSVSVGGPRLFCLLQGFPLFCGGGLVQVLER